MAEASHERLVSSDSHVTVTHDAVKATWRRSSTTTTTRPSSRWAAAASRPARARTRCRSTSKACTTPSAGRATTTPVERLKDMDEDGVDVEVCYCEFSAFRYLYLIKAGWREATQAFNDTLVEFASADPSRLDPLVPDPDPRHRHRGRRGAPRRRARRQVAAAAGVPDRARPARLLGPALRPAVGRDPGDRPAGVLPHRPRADHLLPELPEFAQGTCSRWPAVHVDPVRQLHPGRRVRALPRAQDRVRRAGHRLVPVVAQQPRRDGLDRDYSFPRSPKRRASTTSATCSRRSSTSRSPCTTCATSSASRT